MKRLLHSIIFVSAIGLASVFLAVSCEQAELLEPESITSQYEFEIVGEPVDASLTVTVGSLTVSSSTKAQGLGPEADSEAERHVDDLWVFQYDASSDDETAMRLIMTPQYLTITDQKELEDLNVTLATNNGSPSKVYVVTNTSSKDWVNDYSDFITPALLKTKTIPSAMPIYASDENMSIPMFGCSSTAQVIGPGVTVTVPVDRMYAKLMIAVNLSVKANSGLEAELKSIEIAKVANTCSVGTLYEDDTTVPTYPSGTSFMPFTFTADPTSSEDYPYVIYVPENIQGETDNETEGKKNVGAPTNAMRITASVDLTESDGTLLKANTYTAYPGENELNNFNIRRNCVYRITLNIVATDLIAASANCIVVPTKTTVAFYPYVREEVAHTDLEHEGSDDYYNDYYNFSNHLTWEDDELSIKGLKIIWQTKNCIGDNTTDPAKVRFVENGRRSKIYVDGNEKGNALIAAYNDENCTGKILWSWHIWVTDLGPDNVDNAITYTHYDWNENGIDTSRRVNGYPVMTCNLGALANETGSTWSEYTQTYGLLYQWGRKDPFPPTKYNGKLQAFFNYDTAAANIEVYDNSHTQIDMENNTGGVGEFDTFNTVLESSLTQTKEAGIQYSIENPTVFIAAATTMTNSADSFDKLSSYINQGDWLPEGDDDLWGGNGTSQNNKSYSLKVYSKANGDSFEASLENNYGEYKTIFDPCPYGWRISPGDLWLGLTDNGLNYQGSTDDLLDHINCSETTISQITANMGFHMYMEGWKPEDGRTTFFPTQGARTASGQPMYGGVCGNYHNATVDEVVNVKDNGGSWVDNAIRRVDIIHFHNWSGGYTQVNPFEFQLVYFNRAVAGPVRCVRDTE